MVIVNQAGHGEYNQHGLGGGAAADTTGRVFPRVPVFYKQSLKDFKLLPGDLANRFSTKVLVDGDVLKLYFVYGSLTAGELQVMVDAELLARGLVSTELTLLNDTVLPADTPLALALNACQECDNVNLVLVCKVAAI